jgi:hypothetical protein
MVDKPINSLEELATLTQKEFLLVGERFGGLEQRAGALEKRVDTGFKAITDLLDLMRADLHDMSVALGPLVRTVASLEETVRRLDKRVVRLEEQSTLR